MHDLIMTRLPPCILGVTSLRSILVGLSIQKMSNNLHREVRGSHVIAAPSGYLVDIGQVRNPGDNRLGYLGVG